MDTAHIKPLSDSALHYKALIEKLRALAARGGPRTAVEAFDDAIVAMGRAHAELQRAGGVVLQAEQDDADCHLLGSVSERLEELRAARHGDSPLADIFGVYSRQADLQGIVASIARDELQALQGGRELLTLVTPDLHGHQHEYLFESIMDLVEMPPGVQETVWTQHRYFVCLVSAALLAFQSDNFGGGVFDFAIHGDDLGATQSSALVLCFNQRGWKWQVEHHSALRFSWFPSSATGAHPQMTLMGGDPGYGNATTFFDDEPVLEWDLGAGALVKSHPLLDSYFKALKASEHPEARRMLTVLQKAIEAQS